MKKIATILVCMLALAVTFSLDAAPKKKVTKKKAPTPVDVEALWKRGKRWTRTTEPEGADLQSAAIATMRSSRKEVWDCKGNTFF